MRVHKVKLKATGFKPYATMYIIPNHPDLDKETAISIEFEHEGKKQWITFDDIKNKDFAKTLKFLLAEVESTITK